VHLSNLLITNRYFVGVVKQHFYSSRTVKLHQNYDTVADRSKQIVLVNQIKYIAVSKSASLHDSKVTVNVPHLQTMTNHIDVRNVDISCTQAKKAL